MKERDLERYLVSQAKAHGWECRKVAWQGRRGAPDRVLFARGGVIVWVELKSPGEKPKPHQGREHDTLAELGQTVLVIDRPAQVDAIFRRGANGVKPIELMRAMRDEV